MDATNICRLTFICPHQQKALGQLTGGTNGWTHPFVVMTKATARGSRVAKPLERLREWERKGTGEKREIDEKRRKRDRRQEKQIYCFLHTFLATLV